jgi:hypothetical protein
MIAVSAPTRKTRSAAAFINYLPSTFTLAFDTIKPKIDIIAFPRVFPATLTSIAAYFVYAFSAAAVTIPSAYRTVGK